MSASSLSLDHVGVAVRNLDIGQHLYERLGFQLTPRSFHSGSVRPGGPVERWGSANHCAMLGSGYIEVIGVFDETLHSSAKLLLQRYEGTHIVALSSDDAEALHAAATARGAKVQPAITLERQAAFGPEGDQTRLARFKLVLGERDTYPEARFILIEHQTRDVLWQPHLLTHPNGALALTETWITVPDAAATARRLAGLFGATPVARGPDEWALPLAEGTIFVLGADLVQRRLPGAVVPVLPHVSGFGVAVRDLGALERRLAGNGVAFALHDDGVLVGPAFTGGPVIRFHEIQERSNRA